MVADHRPTGAPGVSDETRDILDREDLIDLRDRWFTRFDALRRGWKPDPPLVLMGTVGEGKADPYRAPERWMRQALDDLATRAEQLADRAVFRPPVIEFGPYGVHFVDRILGAEVFDLDGEGNWQTHCLETPVGALEWPDLYRAPAWLLARRVALAFVEAKVRVPLFGLPTIASALNIAVNLYGQQMLEAMAQTPERAQRDLALINELLRTLHRWYLAHLALYQLQPVVAAQRAQPPGYGQICGCTTQLLSAEMYRASIAPLDDALLSTYPRGGMIHLCGRHTQHLATWREMDSLCAVQLNDRAAEDLEAYYAGLRADQVLYVNPCQGMPVQRILEITGGERTVIVADGLEA
jgi:hypothetical protein